MSNDTTTLSFLDQQNKWDSRKDGMAIMWQNFILCAIVNSAILKFLKFELEVFRNFTI